MSAVSFFGFAAHDFYSGFMSRIFFREIGNAGIFYYPASSGALSGRPLPPAARKSVVGLGMVVTISAFLLGISPMILSYIDTY